MTTFNHSQRAHAAAPAARWRRADANGSASEPAPETAAPPSTSTAASAVAPLGAAFNVFCFYTFILIGRPQDYIIALQSLRLALVFSIITLIVTLTQPDTGAKLKEAFRARETRLYLFFYVAMIVGIPVSIYRPGSFDAVIMRYIVSVIYFVLFLVHVDSMPKLRRVGIIIVASVFIFTMFNLRAGTFAGGRFDNGGNGFDANDVAFIEIALLGFALWVLVGTFSPLMKFTALVTLISGVLLTLYTASRGGFLGLLTFLLLFLWLKLPKVGKGFKAGMLLAIALMAWINIDKIDTERYMTLTSLEDDYNMEQNGRKDIWQRGFQRFLERPITGWGVDGFSAAIGTMRRDEGVQAKWQAAHSAYVLVLTETGLSGTVPFLLLIIRSLVTFNRLRRRGASLRDKDLGMLGGALMIGFTAQLVSAAFLSVAYSMFFTLPFALSGAMNKIAATAETEPAIAEQPAGSPRAFAGNGTRRWAKPSTT